MIQDFKTANLIDMQVPAFLKERLWHEKVTNNAPLMATLNAVSNNLTSDIHDLELIIEDVLRIHQMIKTHAEDFFGVRKNKLPDEIYYALFGRVFIDLNPEWFQNLPIGYQQLSAQLDRIDKTPEIITTNKIEPLARFCHYLEIVGVLRDFRDSLRSGKTNIQMPHAENNNNPAVDIHRRYKLVDHVKTNFLPGYGIVGTARNLTVDIDQFLNHYEDDFSWYARLGVEHHDDVLNADFLFKKMGLHDDKKTHDLFDLSYEFYKAKNMGDPYNAYYEFSEKPLSTLRLLQLSGVDVERSDLLSALSYDALSYKARAPQTSNQSSVAYLQGLNPTLKTAAVTASFATNSMRIWGTAKTPFVMIDEMTNIHDLLIASHNISCPHPALENIFHIYRERALDIYNTVAAQNDIEQFSP